MLSKKKSMKELTKREEQIMDIVWKIKEGYIRDIVADFPEPQPHYNTIATLVKILVKKGYLQSEKIGNTHQYSPTQTFEEYRNEHIGEIKEKFFDNSFPKMIAHFAKSEKLSDTEKKELIKIIKGKES